MSTKPETPVAFRVLAAREMLESADGDSLSNVTPAFLDDGAMCFVLENSTMYVLNKESTATPNGTSVLATINGAGVPGRWLSYPAPPPDPEVFIATGQYTATFTGIVELRGYGCGAGGAGGCRPSDASNNAGGAGGGGGASIEREVLARVVKGEVYDVFMGTEGAGGKGATVASSTGTDGTDGGDVLWSHKGVVLEVFLGAQGAKNQALATTSRGAPGAPVRTGSQGVSSAINTGRGQQYGIPGAGGTGGAGGTAQESGAAASGNPAVTTASAQGGLMGTDDGARSGAGGGGGGGTGPGGVGGAGGAGGNGKTGGTGTNGSPGLDAPGLNTGAGGGGGGGGGAGDTSGNGADAGKGSKGKLTVTPIAVFSW